MKYNEISRDKFKRIDSLPRFGKELLRFIIKKARKYNYYSQLFQKYSESYDYYNADDVYYAFHLYTKRPLSQITFPRALFDKQIKVPFEDIEINIPEGYDEYLRIFFGDYMQLPPEEKRNSGHESIACDMRTPYREYRFSN